MLAVKSETKSSDNEDDCSAKKCLKPTGEKPATNSTIHVVEEKIVSRVILKLCSCVGLCYIRRGGGFVLVLAHAILGGGGFVLVLAHAILGGGAHLFTTSENYFKIFW